MKDLERLSRELIDKGLLVEAGFVSLRIAAMSPAAPQLQIDEMRLAFFAGAQHVFTSIMTMLDPGEEPTDNDVRRMSLIDNELQAFIREYRLKYLSTEGRA